MLIDHKKIALLSLIGFLLVLEGCGELIKVNEFVVKDIQAVGVNEDGPGKDYFPNHELTNQDGETVKFFDDLIKDKVVLLNFIFTSCGSSCPLETARLKKVASLLDKRLGSDIFFYSISIDPDSDSVEILKSYHSRFELKKGWSFLRGKKEHVEEIQKRFGLFNGELKKENFGEHSLNLVMGNQMTGKWIKRSHLEDTTLLAYSLENLHPMRTRPTRLSKFENAPLRLADISKGEQLFYSRCVDCHSIGKDDGIGPDLYNVVKNRDPKWLNRWLKEPDKMIEEKNPLALSLLKKYKNIPMPNLRLSDVDVDALIEFLNQESHAIDLKKRASYEKK
jgi:protein SCO1/2